ncbi:Nif3-like dinuclear metal center hexameric protein [Streptomyces albus]|uniref:Nif3-like dinuclear metal center hexameric protein n=1 Tax=Streptomyces albus TaxID=1888 RepID=UPI0006E22108|nr:Nif3-like dinuclear metal center hexameric protein [Streptomyces albus]
MPAQPSLSEVIAALDDLWPRDRAEQWDAVGTVCGDVTDPEARVGRVLFAVDPVQEIADEAVAKGAQLLVTHHPLYLRGTTTVADALAAALGLRVLRPLVPDATDPAGRRGLGRICELDRPLALGDLVEQAAASLPVTAQGIRAAGDPTATVRTVAVCGGSGDSLFDAVRAAGVDAYLTADLRHHPASEAREHSGLALLDAAHFATEWPWCEQAAAQLDAVAQRNGWDLRTDVSRTVTDPWTAHAPSLPQHSPLAPPSTAQQTALTDNDLTPGAPN